MLLSLLIPVLLLASQSDSADPLPRRGSLGVGFTPLTNKQAEEHGLARGEGLVAGTPAPGLSAEKLGLQNGDRVLRLNGEVVRSSTIQGALRGLPAGSTLSLELVRAGQVLKLNGPLLERPRDPGTANYEVIYSHIVHAGQRMRTIITRPRSPGKHPGFFFIQGFSPVSYDFTLSTATGDVASLDGPLLHKFAESGFATMRVEKPGVGDSEGGPFAELDYQQEIGIYREALAQLKGQSFVDPEDVFVFGHSMGGSFGPMVVADEPVRGIAVYGTAARTWFEYLLDTIRYQGLVAGDNFVITDEKARKGARVMAEVMLLGRSPEELKQAQPELAPWVDAFFPGGLFNGKTLAFWRQLNEINFASYWARLNTSVLAIHGESDFVAYAVDHQLIADIVNARHPGQGRFVRAPQSDHLLHSFATEQESARQFQRGKYSPSVETIVAEWIAEVRSRK